MVKASLGNSLLHDTGPRHVSCSWKFLLYLSLLIGLGSAVLLIPTLVTLRGGQRHLGMQMPVVLSKALASPATVVTARTQLTRGGMHGLGRGSGWHVAAAHTSALGGAWPSAQLGSQLVNEQCAALRARPMAVVTAAAAAAGGSGDDVAVWIAGAGMGEVQKSQPMGSSSWASFTKISTTKGVDLFVKRSSRSADQMFKGEALGMQALYEATQPEGLMRIPKIHHFGDISNGRGSFIIMEYLNFGGAGSEYELGRAMASMHLQEISGRPGRFGFDVDNTIGGTPQKNTWSDDWVEFYRERRLRYQVSLAGDSYITSLFESIAPRLGLLFKDVDVKPSVLHGDLWSGNIGSADGKPSIFDPAVYIGHHEAEWGMSWCAGFGSNFWKGYRELIPEDPGFRDRRPLYDAYHYLNHLNLFGGGYAGSAARALEQVKSKLDALDAR